ncbi:DUF924 family protein [Marinobacter persicus]|uniref:Uncharacterized protein (DUF924 family) n=1 Tax=Marinobacter persicus TaxID=930118 RepID=A0A2S6G7L1_9GAMM|nr:DUF924 family protein [Marinobacter persicus]PPK52179.1 uncharacterized protein (DUF924 family) [Marinobacter persicus]PPK55133.1 uncharacterized protein (DUF924 family) [Marinobacter persicus]PPK58939.1 uncharacterized protein (DUF924 family) [Marinobacter persicus]
MFDWQELLDFWFGPLDESGLPDAEHRNRWFRSDRRFDQEIRRRFLSLVLFASEQGLAHWREQPGGALAEILLLDQFSRNIYRGVALAFENDALACKLCKRAMERGQDQALPAVQRAFLYMPLQHSEKSKDQDLSVECYEQLAASHSGILGDFLNSFLASARDHHRIITRFGRFPHRNRALERRSTPEEEEYLKGASSYGQ